MHHSGSLVALFRIITTIFAHRITVYPDKNFTTDPPGWEGLDHTALRPQKRDEDRGRRGRESEGSTADTARTRPERVVDRRQNYGSIEAVSPRHCAAASAPRICCFTQKNVLGQSHSVLCTAVEEQSGEARSLTFAAQLHLPSHDLFWANGRWGSLKLHLPPLDLAWNPV